MRCASQVNRGGKGGGRLQNITKGCYPVLRYPFVRTERANTGGRYVVLCPPATADATKIRISSTNRVAPNVGYVPRQHNCRSIIGSVPLQKTKFTTLLNLIETSIKLPSDSGV